MASVSSAVRPLRLIRSTGTRWIRWTRMWSPPLRWANMPRSPSAAWAPPWPTNWVQRRRSDGARSEPMLPRAIRWAATGALFIHLALPALMVADVVANPQNLVGLRGGTY